MITLVRNTLVVPAKGLSVLAARASAAESLQRRAAAGRAAPVLLRGGGGRRWTEHLACSRARGLEPAEAVIMQHLGDPPAALQLGSAPRRQGRRRRQRGAVGDRRLRRILLAVLIRDVSDDAAALRPRYLDALCCHLFFWRGLRLSKVGRSRCCGGYRSFPVALCVGVCSLFSGCSQSCRFRPLCRVDNAPRRILCSR